MSSFPYQQQQQPQHAAPLQRQSSRQLSYQERQEQLYRQHSQQQIQQQRHPSSLTSTSLRPPPQGPREKCDQVVLEALCKACEIVLTRAHLQQHASNSNNNQRFNLQVPEIEELRDIVKHKIPSPVVQWPLRLDVYLATTTTTTTHTASDDNSQAQPPQERRQLLERWCLEYQTSTVGGNRLQDFIDREVYNRDSGNTPSYNEQSHHNTKNVLHSDPIAQLHTVCKRIVIWLRTLCCQAQVLPTHPYIHGIHLSDNCRIGFSLYPVLQQEQQQPQTQQQSQQSCLSDDIVELQQQGFVLHHNTSKSSTVVTPYGSLTWNVLHAPIASLCELRPLLLQQQQQRYEHPLSQPMMYNVDTRRTGSSNPIPIANKSNRDGSTSSSSVRFAPQSAPSQVSGMNHMQRTQQRATSGETQSSQQPATITTTGPSDNMATTYDDASHHRRDMILHHHRSVTANAALHADESGASKATMLLRRHTYGDAEAFEAERQTNGAAGSTQPNMPTADGQPERVLSGLSLALMAADDDGGDGKERMGTVRRAEFHQALPHTTLQHQQAPNLAGQGDYGYAYNTHIPWQRIHPSSSKPISSDTEMKSLQSNQQGEVNRTPNYSGDASTPRSSSASWRNPSFLNAATTPDSGGGGGLPLSSTPPTYLASTPPIARNILNSPSSQSNQGQQRIMSTPPFAPRPMGFVKPNGLGGFALDGGLAMQESNPTPTGTSPSVKQYYENQHVLPPLTYDQLQSSPFVQGKKTVTATAAIESSLLLHHSNAASGADGNSVSSRRALFASSPSMMMGSMSGGPTSRGYDGEETRGRDDEDDDYEDMPFAVELQGASADEPDSTTSPGHALANNPSHQAPPGASNLSSAPHSSQTSSLLMSSSTVASFAHKLKTSQRLKFGSSSTMTTTRDPSTMETKKDDPNLMMSSLADQLAEFKSFGESLLQEKPTSSTPSGTSSTTSGTGGGVAVGTGR